jgi:hypothetical protein
MTFNDLVSETEAAELAGVSARTLLRFSESGYLTVDLTLGGGRSYSRAQIIEIFGAPSTAAPYVSEAPGARSVSGETCHASDNSENVSVEEQPRLEVANAEPLSDTPQAPAHEEQSRPSAPTQNDEIGRLRNFIEMQERMLDSKDDEIADLRNQRAWLRERIEKLEEKSDRDQILLLQETQTIRQLIAVQESKKSVVQQVLEWIGVTKSTEVATIPSNSDYSQKKSPVAGSRTIEVEKAANQ